MRAGTVPGLAKEIAKLSGVGVTWYTWLEQGRDISTSVQVIDALVRALLLTGDQQRHLRELAGLPPLEPPVPADDMLPRLQRLSDAQAPCPASVSPPPRVRPPPRATPSAALAGNDLGVPYRARLGQDTVTVTPASRVMESIVAVACTTALALGA